MRGASWWRAAGLLILALVLGCAPAARSAPAAATDATSDAPAAAEAGGWDALVEAARAEGKVVVHGPPTAAVRTDLPRAFYDRFGIEMEYLGGPSGDTAAQLEQERQAGIYSTDAVLAGADSMYTVFYPE